MADQLKAQRRPCAECPWRVDVAPGRFSADRYRALAGTAYDMSQRLFVCHKTPDGKEAVCAGFLARGADHNLAVRLAYMGRRLEFDINRAGPFALVDNYRELAIANGVDPDDPVLKLCR